MENFPQEETMNEFSEAPLYTKLFFLVSMWIFARGHEAIYKATLELKKMPKQWKRKRNEKFRCWVKKSLIVYDDEQQQRKSLKKERIGKI